MKRKIRITRPFKQGKFDFQPGDEPTVDPSVARLLVAVRKAVYADDAQGPAVPAPPPELAERIAEATKPRGAFDHDGDGDNGGSAAPPKTEDLAALRAEYSQLSGKRFFSGWTEDQLREKIAALKAGPPTAAEPPPHNPVG